MSRSTSGQTTAGSVAVLLSVSVSSDGLLTETIFVTPGYAAGSTSTVRVIVSDLSTARGSSAVQVTTWPSAAR